MNCKKWLKADVIFYSKNHPYVLCLFLIADNISIGVTVGPGFMINLVK